MSRSIHTTRRTLKEIQRQRFSDDDVKQEMVAKARFALQRKRRMKRQVQDERRAPDAGREEIEVRETKIVSMDDALPGVFHAASAEDVREMLLLLPPSAVQGIHRIRLLLGKAYMAERGDSGDVAPDPLTGRVGCELFSGVYSGEVLGTYFPAAGRIDLYAYVVDSRRLTAPRAIVELFLRMQALKTLMHEVAHFHDHVARVRRGRWLADRSENTEWYAEQVEHRWTSDFVMPYLERRYGKECQLFRAWMRQRVGVGFSLAYFAGDTRKTERNGLTRLVFSTAGAFECWLERMPHYVTRVEVQLALAWELHYADQYQECLEILDVVIADDPLNVNALSCRADTLVHLERYDEALAVADTVIERAPQEPAAWEARCNVMEHRQNWAQLLVDCERWEQVPGVPFRNRRECHRYRAIAHCALGNLEGMESSLAAFAATIRFRTSESAIARMKLVRRMVFRRAGKADPR